MFKHFGSGKNKTVLSVSQAFPLMVHWDEILLQWSVCDVTFFFLWTTDPLHPSVKGFIWDLIKEMYVIAGYSLLFM